MTEYDTFEVTIVQETANALLVRLKDTNEVWLPKSQLKCTIRYGNTHDARVEVPIWLAEKKGMYVE